MFIETIGLTKSTLLKKFEHIVNTQFPYLRESKLFLAISGGKDSMTLSHLLLQFGIEHTLLHCNFKLRADESDGDEKFVRSYAEINKLILHVESFDTYKISQEQKVTIQECARTLRYDWFKIFLQEENSLLLTAHHRDDSIETFFINLLRGTGFRGLAGIPVDENKIIRPLSSFTNEDIYRYIDTNKIEYRVDSSNAKRDYLRNKIRLDLIPSLVELDPDFQNKMGDIFEELNQVKKLIDLQVTNFNSVNLKKEKNSFSYTLASLRGLDAFFRQQVFRNYGIHQKKFTAFEEFLNAKTGAQFYTDHFSFLKDREEIIITTNSEKKEKVNQQIDKLPFELNANDTLIFCCKSNDIQLKKEIKNLQQVDFSKLNFPLTLRNWQEGDKIKPLGMQGTKLISDILIGKKINRNEKENILVIVNSDENIIAIVGLLVGEDFKLVTNSTTVLEIKLLIN